MKAVTVSFDRGRNMFKDLLKAFTNSWRMNAYIHLEIHYTKPPRQQARSYTFDANHFKLARWIDGIERDTILVDSDMICQKDISRGFDLVDHIGVCQRRGPMPYNGGVIFVKNTRKAREFMNKWLEIDAKMLADPAFHKPWHHKYAGMNQSSFGYLLENGYQDYVTVMPEEFNHCEPWDNWEKANMIHMKGKLRHCLYTTHPPEHLAPIVALWRKYKNMTLS